MTRVVVVVGAGGVGKTTTAAALGALSARDGRRTLVLTVDPARRLAQALGMTLDGEARPVADLPGLEAAMLDPVAAWHSIATNHTDATTAQRLLDNPLFKAIAERFPSGQSYAAGEETLRLVESGQYEVVVVDTPPGPGGAAFLTAPRRMRELVSGRALRILTGPKIPGRRFIYAVTARPAIRMADRILGSRLLEDVAEFLIDLRTTYDGLAARSRAVETMLGVARLVAVATPQTAPVAEARRLLHGRANAVGVVLNQTLPVAWTTAEPGAGPLGENLRKWAAEATQRLGIEERAAAIAPVHRVPWMASVPQSASGLAELAASAGLGGLVS